MVNYVLSNGIQTIITLDDFQFLCIVIFQTALFCIRQVFFFQNFRKIRIKEIVLQIYFRYTFHIVERYGSVILDRFCEIVFADIITKPRIGQSLCSKQRCPCKCQELCVRQTGAHILCQIFVLSTVSLVNDNNNIVTLRQNRIFLSLVISELMNQRKQNRFVGFQFFTQLLAVGRLYLVLIGNKFGTQEVLINLRIQIFTVSNDKEGKIASTFMLDLTCKHNHGIALAAALGMPEHTQLTLQFLTTQESIVSIVHAKELMILCNDLCSAAIVKNEVFYVIQQIFRFTKTGNKILQTGTVLSDSFSVRVFLFVLHLQPFKEKLIPCGKASQTSFHTIRQNTNLVVVE